MAKDTWDKLNIVVSNIILVAISIVIGFVVENISRSLERGKLIDSLLDDLTAPKTETSWLSFSTSTMYLLRTGNAINKR